MPAPATETLRRTPLHDRHAALGGRLVPFAGWEMPVHYEPGIRAEHVAVRTRAGLFDVSHMGQVETRGPDAEAFLQRVLSNDVSRIPPGGAQYSVLCRKDGGVLDDLFTYRLEGGYLTVTNAANHERDLAWLSEHAANFDVGLHDVAADHAMLALQGPQARSILARHLEGEAPARMRARRARVAGLEALVCGTGYTGEDGVELLLPPHGAERVWDALTGDGAAPVGLGARDTLRLEACFHLYGNDLSEDRTPIEAGLGWCCKLETAFVGADAIRAAGEPADRLVPFAFTGPGIPRHGNPILVEGEPAGVVTSGTLSPCLGIGIGLGYVPTAAAEPGTPIDVDVRGKIRPAEVRAKPLYRTDG
ncbi:MAG: glycine cleavage system aminomethyltransferase GcvT [Actinomycetota bacterium]|nr:glycine cleavage system aminomethyltransferase GcvT [Actinomycetota bacterium]